MSKWRISIDYLAILDSLASRLCGGFVMKNSSGGTGLAREERLQIMLSPAELNAVDNYRTSHAEPRGSGS